MGKCKGSFIDLPRTIGVAKSFDKMPEFRIRKGNRGNIRRGISTLLSELDYAHRTVAFSAHGGQVAFWYVRLQTRERSTTH